MISELAISVEDVEYVRHDDGPLLARVYRPERGGPYPAIVSVHGGVWTRETRLTNAPIDQAIAGSGAVVMAIDFRMPPGAMYPIPIQDINLATRWLKDRAGDLGSRPDLVGGIGTSSGGHQLMLSAMRPNDERYCALPLGKAAAAYDGSLAYAVLCWPVIDPLSRYKMAKEKGMTSHLAGHDAYFAGEAEMADGNPQMILDRGEPAALPPTLLIQGTGDAALPPGMAARFQSAFSRAGGAIELRKYSEQPHTFITKEPSSSASLHAIRLIIAFIKYRCALL